MANEVAVAAALLGGAYLLSKGIAAPSPAVPALGSSSSPAAPTLPAFPSIALNLAPPSVQTSVTLADPGPSAPAQGAGPGLDMIAQAIAAAQAIITQATAASQAIVPAVTATVEEVVTVVTKPVDVIVPPVVVPPVTPEAGPTVNPGAVGLEAEYRSRFAGSSAGATATPPAGAGGLDLGGLAGLAGAGRLAVKPTIVTDVVTGLLAKFKLTAGGADPFAAVTGAVTQVFNPRVQGQEGFDLAGGPAKPRGIVELVKGAGSDVFSMPELDGLLKLPEITLPSIGPAAKSSDDGRTGPLATFNKALAVPIDAVVSVGGPFNPLWWAAETGTAIGTGVKTVNTVRSWIEKVGSLLPF